MKTIALSAPRSSIRSPHRFRGPSAPRLLLPAVGLGLVLSWGTAACTGPGPQDSATEQTPTVRTSSSAARSGAGVEGPIPSVSSPASTGEEGAGTAAYVEPAWMARTRQNVRVGDARTASCMAAQGWDGASDGLEVEAGDDERAARLDALRSCTQELWGSGSIQDADHWGVKYDHMVDTRACLLAQGYAIGEPPARAAWVAAAMTGQDLWAPFSQLPRMGSAAFDELAVTCPQDGPTVLVGG